MALYRKWTSTVLVNGQPEPNVRIFVFSPGTTDQIPIYEDEGVTQITQPILTDSQGRYAFFVDVETYPEIRLYLEKDGVDFSEVNEDLDGVPVPGAAAGALGDLSDVTITSPADDELLAYDSGSGKWINQTPSEAGVFAIDGSVPMQAKAPLSYGADLGLTSSADRRTDNAYFARWYNIENVVMLDYQDEFALLNLISGRSASASPSSSGGNINNVFMDDSSFISWNAGTDVSAGIVITVDCSGNPIPDRYSAAYRLSLTFRGESASYPTHIKVEDWDDDASTWVAVVDADVTVTDDVVLLPRFFAQSSDHDIHKLRITLTVPSPLPATLRLQRVILYHCTSPWDPWHLHKAGDTMYGNIDMKGNNIDNVNSINPSGGNVGIGTTSPGYKLDVSGDIHCTGKVISDEGATFTELTDTPSSYVGRGGDVVVVKTSEDGIETQPWPVTGTVLNVFLSDDAADVGSYYYMYPSETGGSATELTSSSLSTGDDQLLWSFVTEAGEPGIDQLALGAYTATLFLKKSGNKDVRVYWKLFKRDTGGTETEVLQSAVSDYLTADNSQYLISAYLNEDQALDPTDRLVLKLYANVSGTGTDVTVTLTMEGDYDSRLAIHVLSSAFDLDRLSDVTIASPADNELLAYDSGSGKWKNQAIPEHGNESHNPDFLPVDGSSAMQGNLSFDNQNREILNCILGIGLYSENRQVLLPFIQNDEAYLTSRGGSIAFSQAPYDGSADRLCDGASSFCEWKPPPATLTITVTLSTPRSGGLFPGIVMHPGLRAQNILIEVYDSTAGTWKAALNVSNYENEIAYGYIWVGGNQATQVRYTLSNYTDPNRLIINELPIAVLGGEIIGSYALKRNGGDMYGDIDMNGNDIDNLNCINSSGGDVGIGMTSPGYTLDVSGDIHCTGKLTSDGGNDPPYVLYNYETRASIVERVKREVLPDKLNGAVLFFNGDQGQLELFLPSKGEFRSLDGKVLETVKPITRTFETEDRYYFDDETGKIKSYKVKKSRAKYRLKPDHELDPLTGKIKRKIKEKKKDPKTGEKIEEVIGEEEVALEEAIKLVKEDGR